MNRVLTVPEIGSTSTRSQAPLRICPNHAPFGLAGDQRPSLLSTVSVQVPADGSDRESARPRRIRIGALSVISQNSVTSIHEGMTADWGSQATYTFAVKFQVPSCC